MITPPRGAARIRDVVGRVSDPDDPLAAAAAVELVTAADVEQCLHPNGAAGGARLIASGIGASPGVVTGEAVFSVEAALDRAEAGRPVILVRPTTGPADASAFAVVVGVLTSGGGVASHAGVLARGRGLPAVCGASSLELGADSFTAADGTVVRDGDLVSIDGTTGDVLVGAAEVEPVDLPDELDELLAWADEIRAGSMGVWANADTAADARRALAFGAEGIGLCRIEHLLVTLGLLPTLQDMLLTESLDEREDAADLMLVALREELVALLEVMDGHPVTVRLLDLPLDELFDGVEVPQVLHEHDPMLGVRGVRLLLIRPDLLRVQVEALTAALAERLVVGGRPEVRVSIPFVSTASELVLVRGHLGSVLAEADALHIQVGAMVETPRAALRCADLAAAADFLSVGTNDLTQLTFGLSRDDAGPVLDDYLGHGLLAADPFDTIDADGVGALVALAVERARDVDPAIEITVCGEHGGDPASIAFFRSLGIDHVSCSPFRVPVARLAVARSVLGLTP